SRWSTRDQMPFLSRNVSSPESAEMPAPVRTTMDRGLLNARSKAHPVSNRSCARAAHRHLVHPQMRLSNADRYALSGLSAHADAGIELHVVADHGHAVHRVWAVANQHGALDGLRHPAVLDHVGLGASEDELSAGDVDLTAAEGNGIDAVLHRGDDLFRRPVA